MSYCCYAINEEKEFGCSWWEWLPLWNYIAPRAALSYAIGLTNDFHPVFAERLIEVLEGTTAETINIEWLETGAVNCGPHKSPLNFLSKAIEQYSISEETLENFRNFLADLKQSQFVIGG